jgi:hypothetical protein
MPVQVEFKFVMRSACSLTLGQGQSPNSRGSPSEPATLAVRTRQAVERPCPFAMLTQTLVVVWYHLASH